MSLWEPTYNSSTIHPTYSYSWLHRTIMNTVAFNKFKQQVCENSAELKDFERRLQTAYNRQILEAQLAAKQVEMMKIRIEEKQLAEIEREHYAKEELRVLEEEKCKREEERKAACILKKQMMIKQYKQMEEMQRDSIERATLEEQLRVEHERELLQEREMQEEKARRLRDQRAVLELQAKLCQEERERQAEEEKRIQEEANRLQNFDEAIIADRQRRMREFEALKEALLKQLVERDRIKREKEDIMIRLHCLEKEEDEARKLQEEQKAMLLRKERARCTYDEVTRDKRLEVQRAKEEDKCYADQIKSILQWEEERAKLAEKETKRIRTAVRIENHQLMSYRQHERMALLQEERARAEADLAEREKQDSIVREERLRLLRLIGEDMRKFLPPGTVTEEDLLCLNAEKPQCLNTTYPREKP